MITAEILKPCVVCCQPGSVVEVTETQFRCLGGAARALEKDAPVSRKIAAETESVEKAVENVENVPEAATEESTDIPAPEEESSEKAVEHVPEGVTEESTENVPEKARKKSRKKA